MPQTFVTTFIVLCFLGILDSGYLVWKHRRNSHTPLVCPLDHDCSKVTESKWSHIFGVRNEVLGLGFYVVLLAVTLFPLFKPAPSFFPLLLLFLSAGGTLFSLFLLYVQLKIIKDYCFYCIISALITVLLLLNSLALLPLLMPTTVKLFHNL